MYTVIVFRREINCGKTAAVECSGVVLAREQVGDRVVTSLRLQQPFFGKVAKLTYRAIGRAKNRQRVTDAFSQRPRAELKCARKKRIEIVVSEEILLLRLAHVDVIARGKPVDKRFFEAAAFGNPAHDPRKQMLGDYFLKCNE